MTTNLKYKTNTANSVNNFLSLALCAASPIISPWPAVGYITLASVLQSSKQFNFILNSSVLDIYQNKYCERYISNKVTCVLSEIKTSGDILMNEKNESIVKSIAYNYFGNIISYIDNVAAVDKAIKISYQLSTNDQGLPHSPSIVDFLYPPNNTRVDEMLASMSEEDRQICTQVVCCCVKELKKDNIPMAFIGLDFFSIDKFGMEYLRLLGDYTLSDSDRMWFDWSIKYEHSTSIGFEAIKVALYSLAFKNKPLDNNLYNSLTLINNADENRPEFEKKVLQNTFFLEKLMQSNTQEDQALILQYLEKYQHYLSDCAKAYILEIKNAKKEKNLLEEKIKTPTIKTNLSTTTTRDINHKL